MFDQVSSPAQSSGTPTSTTPRRALLSLTAGMGSRYRWSYFSGFRSRDTEAEYRQFIRPPPFTFITLAIILLLVVAILFVVTPPFDTPWDTVKVIVQWNLLGAGTLLTVADVALLILVVVGRITPMVHSWWHMYLRAGVLWVLLFGKLTISLQFWECPHHPDAVLRRFCYSSIAASGVVLYFIALLLHVPFAHYALVFVVDAATEIALALIPSLKGQPVEASFSRPYFCACLGAITLTMNAWNERDSRRRFLDAKCLELERSMNQLRKSEVAAGLGSICDRQDLPALLSGVPVRHESSDAGVLLTEIANMVPWRLSHRPIHALHFLSVLYDGIDTKRITVGQPAPARSASRMGGTSRESQNPSPPLGPCGVLIERMWWKGDTYVTAVGLRSRSTALERRVLVRFAAWQLSFLRVVTYRHSRAADRGYPQADFRSLSTTTNRYPELRFGFGRGSCISLQIPSSTIVRIYMGSAVEQAKSAVRTAPASTVKRSDNPLLMDDALVTSQIVGRHDEFLAAPQESRTFPSEDHPLEEALQYSAGEENAELRMQHGPIPSSPNQPSEGATLAQATFPIVIESRELKSFLEQNSLVEAEDMLLASTSLRDREAIVAAEERELEQALEPNRGTQIKGDAPRAEVVQLPPHVVQGDVPPGRNDLATAVSRRGLVEPLRSEGTPSDEVPTPVTPMRKRVQVGATVTSFGLLTTQSSPPFHLRTGRSWIVKPDAGRVSSAQWQLPI